MKKLFKRYADVFNTLDLDDRAVFVITAFTPLIVGIFIPIRLVTKEYNLVVSNTIIVITMVILHALYFTNYRKHLKTIFYVFFFVIVIVLTKLKGEQQIAWVYSAMAVLYFATTPKKALLINSLLLACIGGMIYGEVNAYVFILDVMSLLSLIIILFILSQTSLIKNERTKVIAEKNKQESLIDPLTRLLNRRAFDAEIGKATQDILLQLKYKSLLLIDIDFFKRINDTYGHDVGDKVLSWAADIMKKNARECEKIFRFGGEEFAVIIVSDKKDIDIKVGERIRSMFDSTLFENEKTNESLHVTVSVGIATSAKEVQPEHLFDVADKNLYKAKKGGRNSVVMSLL